MGWGLHCGRLLLAVDRFDKVLDCEAEQFELEQDPLGALPSAVDPDGFLFEEVCV